MKSHNFKMMGLDLITRRVFGHVTSMLCIAATTGLVGCGKMEPVGSGGGGSSGGQGSVLCQRTVTLTWEMPTADTNGNPATPDGARIYRSMSSGGPYTFMDQLSGSTATSYVFASVCPGTYYYVVTATLGGTESVYSNEASAVVPATLSSLKPRHPELIQFPDLFPF